MPRKFICLRVYRLALSLCFFALMYFMHQGKAEAAQKAHMVMNIAAVIAILNLQEIAEIALADAKEQN